MVKLIAAVGKNLELGKNNGLMWDLPGDMKFFRATTKGACVVMGRLTYDSIGRPLPYRRNIVISRNPELEIEGVEVVTSLESALKACQNDCFVIGGEKIYSLALPYADEIYLTEIDAEFEGADTFFPKFEKESYTREVLAEGSDNGINYQHVLYKK